MRFSCNLLVIATVALTARAQQWTDRAEYDVVLALRAEASPARQIEVIQTWKQKYPHTQLGQIRSELELSAYVALKDVPKILDVARQMVAANPSDLSGAYWLTSLAPAAPTPSPELLTAAETAAQSLPRTADQAFGSGKTPPGLSVAEWQKQRADIDYLSHRTLGWVAWQRGTLDRAESEFRTCLEKNPNSAEMSAWLGAVLAVQNTPAHRTEAVWHLARASATDGENALTSGQRRDARAMLDRVYVVHRGDMEGIDQVLAQSLTSVLPPEGFRVETAVEAAQRKQDESLAQTNPDLMAWVKIRRQLEGPDSPAKLEALRASPLPKLKGWIVRQNPATRPTELVIGVQEVTIEEVQVRLDSPLPGKADAGTPVEIEGAIIESFNPQPFLLVVHTDKNNISGWPAVKKR